MITAIVTGATGAIGSAIALGLAKMDIKVILIVRNEQKVKPIIKNIINVTKNKEIHYKLADLSRKTDILYLSNNWNERLDILINNAACTPKKRKETPEGIELQFATNVLSYFWMINTFTPFLKKNSPSRIINVASYWAGDLDFNDLEFKNKKYRNGTAYRQSKQANRLLTGIFAEMLKDFKIYVNSCHPGDVNSKLSNNLGFGGHMSPKQGAETPVWLATNKIGLNLTGNYFENKTKTYCPYCLDLKSGKKLYNICKAY